MQIYKSVDGDGIIIAHGPNNTLQVDTIESLIELQHQITDYIDTLPDSQLINITTARSIAKEQGYQLHRNTIGYACKSGAIVDAQNNGRWKFPRKSFLQWFERHKRETRGR